MIPTPRCLIFGVGEGGGGRLQVAEVHQSQTFSNINDTLEQASRTESLPLSLQLLQSGTSFICGGPKKTWFLAGQLSLPHLFLPSWKQLKTAN